MLLVTAGGIHGMGAARHAHARNQRGVTHHYAHAGVISTPVRHRASRNAVRRHARAHHARGRHVHHRARGRRARGHRHHQRELVRARRHRTHLRHHRAHERRRAEIRKGIRSQAHIASLAIRSLAQTSAVKPTADGLLIIPDVGLPRVGARSVPDGTLHSLVPADRVRGGQARRPQARAHASRRAPKLLPDPSRPNVIERFVRVVPSPVWIALAAALALAASAAAGAAAASRRARRNAAQFAAMSAQALTDPLTGVLNRRGFLDAAERELARARRYDRAFALAYIDVRGLKGVNDSEGHLAGDELLRQAAGLLKESARGDDVVGRIGGDELALLLAEQSTDGAAAVAARIREQVPERRAALQLRRPWDLTIGTAAYPDDGSTIEELLAAADRRLYEQRGIELR